MNSLGDLRGLNVVVAAHKRRHMIGLVDDGYEGGDVSDDGFLAAVAEVVGFDMNTLTPYLSALAQGFTSDDQAKAKAAEEAAKKAAEEAKKEEERKAKASKTTTYVVLGVVGVAVAGAAAFFLGRRK